MVVKRGSYHWTCLCGKYFHKDTPQGLGMAKSNHRRTCRVTAKVFDFIFKGHQYTASDRASNQSRCPHCDEKSPDKFMWRCKTSPEAYLGYVKFSENNYVVCFECPKCHEKFFYHLEYISELERDVG